MKILHLNSTCAPTGGGMLYVLNVMAELQNRGHRCILVSGGSEPERACALDCCSEVVLFPEAAAYVHTKPVDVLRKFETLVQRIDPDVIHIHAIDNPYVIRRCIELRPTVRTYHDYKPLCPGSLRYYRTNGAHCNRALSPYCLLSAYVNWCNNRNPVSVVASYRQGRAELEHVATYKRLIVASEYVRQRVLLEGLPDEFVVRLPYFTYLPETTAVRPSNNHLTGRPQILFLGRVAEVKGLDRLLQAMPLVDYNAELIVAGDGYSLASVQTLVARLNLNDRVKFVGWQTGSAKQRLLAGCSLLVIPSLWPEPFGIVGLEAMAHGKPVVAFDVGGISEWLVDGQTGFLVPPYDVEIMASRINQLLSDSSLSVQMGALGREAVQRRFSPEQHIEHLVKIYQQAVQRIRCKCISIGRDTV